MAKDGTLRGGARVGAGRKPKALSEKLSNGNPGGRRLTQIEIPDLPEPPYLEGEDMPKPGDYLSEKQRDGSDLGAGEIFNSVYKWLAMFRCDKIVSPQLIEQYAMSVARWIQCEKAISRFGLLGRHPTCPTSPVQSPYVAMGQNYMKQSTQLWYQIYGVVKENCSVDVSGPNPMDDVMERLLRSRK